MFPHAKILIVDDQIDNVQMVTSMLELAGYSNVIGITHSPSALDFIQQWHPDIVLLDLMMSYMDGFEVMLQLQTQLEPHEFLPILVLTADGSATARERALSLGAHDFLHRPFEVFDITLRVKNLLNLRFQNQQLLARNAVLEHTLAERTRRLEDSEWELREAQLEVIERLARGGEYRDEATGLHTHRVARQCRKIAEKLGLSQEQAEIIRRAAPLHDVGKIGVSDSVLLKPGQLTSEEYKHMQQHTIIGARLLAGGRSDLIITAESIALSHHERWDGTGYPFGLKGKEIPIEARILAVADVFDALIHERPYKTAWSLEDAEAEIQTQRGRQFDPDVVDAFFSLHQKVTI